MFYQTIVLILNSQVIYHKVYNLHFYLNNIFHDKFYNEIFFLNFHHIHILNNIQFMKFHFYNNFNLLNVNNNLQDNFHKI